MGDLGQTTNEALARRVSRVESGIGDVTRRIDLIQQAETFLREAQEQRERHMDERFGSIDRKLDRFIADYEKRAEKTETFQKQLLLLVIGAVVSFIITFALKGGFNVPV